MSASRAFALRRRPVVEALLEDRGDLLVVSGLGAPTWDAAAAGDHALTFPMWGAMGGALPMGLGLALAQPEQRVLVITGDGEMLMGLGAIATTGAAGPGNLGLAVLDNESYGETGMQATHTAFGVDLAAMAAAARWPVTGTVTDESGLDKAVSDLRWGAGPVFHAFKVRAEILPLVLPPRDGEHLKDRFRAALPGGEPGDG